MAFLLDTNVLSEPARKGPDAGVMAWLRSLDPLETYISVLTLGEIEKGVALMPNGARRRALERWLSDDLPGRFRGRVLAVDSATAAAWGRLDAAGHADGRPLPVVDGLLLATAQANGLTFATRNEHDCRDRGVPILNPWGGSGSTGGK